MGGELANGYDVPMPNHFSIVFRRALAFTTG